MPPEKMLAASLLSLDLGKETGQQTLEVLVAGRHSIFTQGRPFRYSWGRGALTPLNPVLLPNAKKLKERLENL